MRRLLLAVLCVAGCATHAKEIEASGPPPIVDVHDPYRGIPQYLATTAPTATEVAAGEKQLVAGRDETTAAQPQAVTPEQRLTPAQRVEKIRANLAAVDALVAALGDNPATKQQRLVLMAIAGELQRLLVAWPDIGAEADELVERTGQLGQGLKVQQPRLKQRIFQLTDLIRLQLMASQ
jgi:hypothetical protein